jgi:hypothetical protein
MVSPDGVAVLVGSATEREHLTHRGYTAAAPEPVKSEPVKRAPEKRVQQRTPAVVVEPHPETK